MSAAGVGVDPGRVAQLRVEYDSGSERGAGYRVTATTVLTAAHVVAGAQSVEVVFNPNLPEEWSVPATVALCAPAGDVAVLRIDPPEAYARVEPARFGQIGMRAAVLPCRAVGFPRFKLRTETMPGAAPDAAPPPYRDAHQADGTIGSLSGWREGTLEITVAPPGRDPDPHLSPWEGMSGAALWCADRIVGVVSRHHRNEGPNRLAAVRTGRWYDQLGTDQLRELRELVGLPDTVGQLVDVIPAEPAQLVAAAYTAYIEDIAPISLQDREQELAELTGFCAGDEFYGWWQAGPWAGKTALTSWFAMHPPVGVSVVSFFITRRLAGQANSSAYTEAQIEQLTALTGEPTLPADSPAARDGHRRQLLKKATEQTIAAGRRLLLLVDGLDEDEGVPPAGPSSIAALLPRRPIYGLRVLVTSRPYPGLPHDVPADHPLRSRSPRELARSELGEQLKVLAKTELIEHLQKKKNKLAKDIIGYIAGAGGGLTLAELGELTKAGYVDLQAQLGSVFGRSMRRRTPTDLPAERAEPVYLFAHETLRELADEQLGSDLQRYRDRIHGWAGSYQQRDWPADTPRYLGRPYSRLLIRTRDLPRLMRLLTQPARHDHMLAATLADTAALAEILDTQQLLLDIPEPDLTALALLAVERYRLSIRNDALPAQLPALWVRLGQPHRGEALARSITGPSQQAQALTAVARAWADAGQTDRAEQATMAAEQTARSITDPWGQAEALTELATAWADAGQTDRAEQAAMAAEQAARSITGPLWAEAQAQALTAVAKAWAAVGRTDRAEQAAMAVEQAARSITDPSWQAWALSAVARAWVAAGQTDQAEQLARSITHPSQQAWALSAVATAWAAAGQTDQAEQLARSITHPSQQAQALSAVATAWAAAGQTDQAKRTAMAAEQTARTTTDPDRQAEALSAVATAWAAAGQTDQAEQLARSITHPSWQAQTLTAVARAWAAAGQTDQAEQAAMAAEQTARTTTDPNRQAEALSAVATAWAAAGQADQAEQLARSITDPSWQEPALTAVARAWAAAGQADQAEQLARSITDSYWQAQALTAVATAWAAAGQTDRAEQAAMAAEQTARTTTDPDRQAQALSAVATAWAAAGQTDQAEQLARSITDPYWQPQALSAVATAWAAAGQTDQAEQLARSITHPTQQAQALTAVATAWAAAGQTDQAEQAAMAAEQTARSTTDPYLQAEALTAVATAWAAAGQTDRAEQAAMAAEQAARTTTDPNRQAGALSAVATAWAAAGRTDQAEQLARSITDSFWQAHALTDVAAVSARQGSASAQARSRRVTATLLTSSTWYRAMPVLVELAPATVAAAGGATLELVIHSPRKPRGTG